MSLDIAVLDDNGAPARQVSIDIRDHCRLMQQVNDSHHRLLQRISDYYTDVEYSSNELDSLIAEVSSVLLRCRNDQQLTSILEGLCEVAKIAKKTNVSLFALAD